MTYCIWIYLYAQNFKRSKSNVCEKECHQLKNPSNFQIYTIASYLGFKQKSKILLSPYKMHVIWV